MGTAPVRRPSKVKLTVRTIESLSPRPAVYTVWDSEIRGFGVRVLKTGQKSFVLKFSLRRQQRWITLGRFRELSLESARKLALMKRGEIAQGMDPSQEARARKNAPTVSELIDRFVDEHVLPKTRASTAQGYSRYLNQVVRPRLGAFLVQDVTSKEIAEFHHSLRETPRQANQAVAILRKMFECAETWKFRPQFSNPCRSVTMFPEKRRTRFLETHELAALGAVLTEMEREGSAPAPAVAAIRLLLLTGARHNEILKLQWRQVDFERRLLRFNPEEHKTGGSKGMKTVPLSAPALAILEGLPRVLGNPFVIPGGLPGKHFVGLQKVWERIRRRVTQLGSQGKKGALGEAVNIEDVRIHDLRHTFASVGVSSGRSLPEIASLLGQEQLSITERYSHMADNARFQASEKIAGSIASSLGVTTPRPPSS